MRYAIYFTPERDHPLTVAAARWLGRDAFGGEETPPPAVAPLTAAEVASHGSSAGRYGFHATLKAPFTLAAGETAARLERATLALAASLHPVTIPKLVPCRIDGFFALVPDAPLPPLDSLAAAVVDGLDAFRAPPSEAEVARRNPAALSQAELGNLMRWGYPYVFETFRFHMTLTGRVADAEAPRVAAAIEAMFAPVLAAPVEVDALSVFVEPEPGAPFVVLSSHRLGANAARRIA